MPPQRHWIVDCADGEQAVTADAMTMRDGSLYFWEIDGDASVKAVYAAGFWKSFSIDEGAESVARGESAHAHDAVLRDWLAAQLAELE